MSLLLTLCLMVASLAAAADLPEIPVELAPDTSIRLAKYFRYASLELEDAQGEPLVLQGHKWEINVNYQAEVEAIRDHFRRLAGAGGEVLSASGSRGLHFRLDQAEGPLYVKLHVGGSNYSLKMVRPAPCPREVVLGNGVYATPRKPELALTPPLITDYPDSKLTTGKEHEFDRLEVEYRVGREAIDKTVEGRYWKKHVQVAERSGGPVHHEEIREAYRLAALDAGAEILDTRTRKLVFRYPDPENGDLWVELWPNEGKYTLDVIQEKAMQQVLVLEKDEMMARLDALGKLTLRGIFFDTARAVLKPESEPGLQAALDLLTAYPDLVLEVGGHTDNVGLPADNQTLSENRAASVRAWLVEHGVAAERLQARGFGEERPVATNTTEVGRAANRRVELTKISGGTHRDLVTLIAPYPGSVKKGEDEVFADRAVTFFTTDAEGRTREMEVQGSGILRRFEVQDERGRPDASLSGVQIRSNYRRAVLDLGGEILAERTHGLYFRLRDAEGKATLFRIWAPGAKYSITSLAPGNSGR